MSERVQGRSARQGLDSDILYAQNCLVQIEDSPRFLHPLVTLLTCGDTVVIATSTTERDGTTQVLFVAHPTAVPTLCVEKISPVAESSEGIYAKGAFIPKIPVEPTHLLHPKI